LRRKGYINGLTAVVCMSTVPVTIKAIDANPWVIGNVRLFLAAVILFILFPACRGILQLSWRDRGILLLMGLCFGLHWLTYFFSIKWGSATMAVVATISFYGLFSTFLGAIFLGHKVRIYHYIGLALCIAGTLLAGGQFEAGSSALLGFGMGIASGFFFGLLPTLHQKSKHMDTTVRSFGQYAGALLFFLFTVPLGNWSLAATDWLGLVYLGLIGTVLAHTLWVFATTELPTTSASVVKYLYIPLTALVSYFLLGERLAGWQAVGTVMIVFGSLLGLVGGSLHGLIDKWRVRA